MVTSEFTRRGFLKGLSAVAGLITVPMELHTPDNKPLIWTPDQPTPTIMPEDKIVITVTQGDKIVLKYSVNPYGHLAWMSSPGEPVVKTVYDRRGKGTAYLRELSLHTTMHRIDQMKHRTFVSSTGHVVEHVI